MRAVAYTGTASRAQRFAAQVHEAGVVADVGVGEEDPVHRPARVGDDAALRSAVSICDAMSGVASIRYAAGRRRRGRAQATRCRRAGSRRARDAQRLRAPDVRDAAVLRDPQHDRVHVGGKPLRNRPQRHRDTENGQRERLTKKRERRARERQWRTQPERPLPHCRSSVISLLSTLSLAVLCVSVSLWLFTYELEDGQRDFLAAAADLARRADAGRAAVAAGALRR